MKTLADPVRSLANLSFTGEEYQRILGPRFEQLLQCIHHRLRAVALLLIFVYNRPVTNLHRKGASGHHYHRRIIEVPGKALGVDGGRGDDQLQVGAFRQQGFDEAEDQVDIQAALMRLIDDQGLVFVQPAIALDLGQQDAIRHQLDVAVRAGGIGEAHLVAHRLPRRCVQLFGDATGHRTSRQTTRLGMTDLAPVRQP